MQFWSKLIKNKQNSVFGYFQLLDLRKIKKKKRRKRKKRKKQKKSPDFQGKQNKSIMKKRDIVNTQSDHV